MKSKRHLSKWDLLSDILVVVFVWLIALALLYLVIVKLNLTDEIGISK